ncbi:MAG: transposase family protein [Candidatus Caenarcaniphilales bacterium]|nr:transposase family protein [Candidatus Caenarcaniphilales bacterium]
MSKNLSGKKKSRKDNAKFKRKWGVTPEIFNKMVSVFAEWKGKNKDSRGRKSELTIPQKVEVTLMYWREYRTQFHIAENYGVAESTICRAIQEVENALSASGEFRVMDGKRDLLDDKEDEIVIDVMEWEIERPQKNKRNIIRVKRNDTR